MRKRLTRAEQQAETRTRVFEAAIKVFARRGRCRRLPADARLSHASALGAAVVLLLATATGCGSDGAGPQEGGRTSASTGQTTSTGFTVGEDEDAARPPTGALSVSFHALDGVRLEGRLLRGGRVAVVFAHMGNPGDNQSDWFELAARLGRRGYTVLTFNRRGVCPQGRAGCSEGVEDYASSWKDVVGAVRFVEGEGASRVILVGASIGAMSSLYAISSGSVDAAGLIEIAGINDASGYSFSPADLKRVDCPKLFVSARQDPYAAALDARQWFRWASATKRLVLLPGGQHGTDMLRPDEPTAPRMTRLVTEFVDRIARAG